MIKRLITFIFIAGLFLAIPAWPASATQQTLESLPSSGIAGEIPVGFVPNQGQWETSVRFKLETRQAAIWVLDDVLWLTVMEEPPSSKDILMGAGDNLDESSAQALSTDLDVRTFNLKLSLEGTNKGARTIPLEPQNTRMGFFIGDNESRWQADVPAYGAVRWESLYPGVNLTMRGQEGRLSFMLETAELKALSQVRLRLEGASGIRESSPGVLTAETPLGLVELPAFIDSQGQPLPLRLAQDEITIDWRFRGKQTASPGSTTQDADAVANVISFTTLGGGSVDTAYAIAEDYYAIKNKLYAICIAGETYSTDLPTLPGLAVGKSDILVAAMDMIHNQNFLYRIGGTGADAAYAISSCSISETKGTPGFDVAGYSDSQDFPSPSGLPALSAQGKDAVLVGMWEEKITSSLMVGGNADE
jgi:hypothetical protein